MKKIVFVMLAAMAFGCDAPNRSAEPGAGSETEAQAPADPESDESGIHSDTTTSGGVNRQNQYDTLE